MHGSDVRPPQHRVSHCEDRADLSADPEPEVPAQPHRDAMAELQALVANAIQSKVAELEKTLLSRGLVTLDPQGNCRPGSTPCCAPRYARARNAPARARRKLEFAIRRGLNRPRTDGSKAFSGGGDAGTLVSTVTGPSAILWADSALFRTGLNASTASTGPGFEPPAGALPALGIAGGVAAGCSLLDGLDMFNTFLDAVDEQDRWKVEVVVFHRHYRAYLDNRAKGEESSPEVVYGFRRCQTALSRCALFDKAARQAWRRCCAAALRDSVLTTATSSLGVTGMGMKIASGANLASLGLGTAGLALGAAGLPLSLACAGIDGVVGYQEIGVRKQEYRRCKDRCASLRQQIDSLLATPAAQRSDDHDVLLQVLEGALKRQRHLKKQARLEMRCGGARLAKGVANAAVSAPLATGAIVAGAVATSAVAWPVGLAATVVGGVVGAAYLGSYVAKAATRGALRARLRREQYDATLLAATTSAADRAVLRAELQEKGKRLSVAGTQGYWTGGRDGFAGRHIHEVSPEMQAVAALDEFAGLLARLPPAGRPDNLVEHHIKATLALEGIDEPLFHDIERMIRAGSDERRRQGAHPRDIEWQELMARRREYAAAFGLPAAPPKLAPGALLPSFHAACWIERLGKSRHPEAGKFVKLLERHLAGEQVDLHAMNEWLDRHGHLAASAPLTQAQMQATAERLFRSVPPALFIEQTKSLLRAIADETGGRQGFGWQDDSPVLRDLKAFCEFAETQWIAGPRALSRICGHAVGAEQGARTCTADELSKARRHLASGASMPLPWASAEDRKALESILGKAWRRRFTGRSGGGRRLTCAALGEHCAVHGKHAGRPWAGDSNGNFHCDLGGGKMALIRAADLARWVTRGDWRHPLPIETRSSAPASAMLWLTNEPGCGVDERFIQDAGIAPTLLDLDAAFERSAPPGGMRLCERLIELDAVAGPGESPCKGLLGAMGQTRRLALAVPHGPSTRPWALLERQRHEGKRRWQLEAGGRVRHFSTLEKAVRACGNEFGQDALRAVFLANPP